MLVYLVSAATACFSSDLEKLINIVALLQIIPTSLAISKSACLKLCIPKTYLSSLVRLLD